MIFDSPHAAVSIPDVSLPEYVLHRCGDLAGKPAFVDGTTGRSLSYGELGIAVSRGAAALAARGFDEGDVFAILSPNLPEYAAAFFAPARLGGIVTTLNPLWTPEESERQLSDSGARFLFTVPPLLEKAAAAAAPAGVEAIFVLGDVPEADLPVPTTPFSELLAADGEPPPVDVNPGEDVVALPYSSGTTGFPKGVKLTHRNLVANLEQMGAVEPVGEDEAALGVLPFFHIYGMVVVMSAVLREGATVVTMPRYDLEGMLELMERYGITRASLVPPIVRELAKDSAVERYELDRLRVIGSGAAPLGAEVQRACADRLDCDVRQGYGLTETSPATHYNPPGANREGSVGPPLPNTEMRIVDVDSGGDLGPDERGEVLIRGPQVMQGYLDRPQETAETLDADGWLHTGDVGYVDGDGYLYVVDRVKELIKYKGYQVAPAELEGILQSHRAVRDAAVIPSPDPEAGEVPKAMVVRADGAAGAELDGEGVRALVADRVAPYKKVRRVEFVDEIPKSASGKILRRVLVERERAGGSGDAGA